MTVARACTSLKLLPARLCLTPSHSIIFSSLPTSLFYPVQSWKLIRDRLTKSDTRIDRSNVPLSQRREKEEHTSNMLQNLKFAAENGNKAAVDKFSKVLSRPVRESTMRGIKKAYYIELQKKRNHDAEITRLEYRLRGRPLLLGKLDANVQEYIRKLRLAGCVINRTIVVAAARGIVEHLQPSLLHEYGGPVEPGRKWAESLMRRMGLVKRKATKAARKVPDDLESVKAEFVSRVTSVIAEDKIPQDLIINWDQTAAKFVPTSEWTMAEEGSRQVEVFGLEDKREMTVLLTCTLSGTLLPPQLIYGGKTPQCHPRVDFPQGWDVWHSSNHWSTEDTMLRYVDTVLLPYVQATRCNPSLSSDYPALAIFDVFAAH